MMLFRYKHEIRAEDKAALQKLMKRQYHYLVTPEVYRELEASRWLSSTLLIINVSSRSHACCRRALSIACSGLIAPLRVGIEGLRYVQTQPACSGLVLPRRVPLWNIALHCCCAP